MKKLKIPKRYAKDGYWYRTTQFESCCDCGLCHKKEYKIKKFAKGFRLYFRAWRDEEKTKKNRIKIHSLTDGDIKLL